jgi:hypothetical protein
MTAHTASVIGYVAAGVGTLFLFLDSLRISRRLPRTGFTLGDSPAHQRWFFSYSSPIGFGALFVGFVFQFMALFL